ncbi:hypothetical protein AB0I60_06180 [Actinosynnema sp. NPDC050436]|uniref:hypothetical protein n=1 Tax=Actinosynnema sp. NPDC050436 TaxID=3155659 RepID=UPI0033F8C1C8
MFKKLRDQIDHATRQATARAAQDFQWHAAQFQQEAARQGHHIHPQAPTPDMAAEAFRAMGQDPAMVEFTGLPAEEQIRQQGLANEYGQNLRRLHEHGEPATAVIRTLDPTGVTVAAQPQYTSVLDVTRADGTGYRTTITHLVPNTTFAQYVPGTRHHVRIDRANPHAVGVFELLP